MLELLAILSFVGYLIYLRNYADQRTEAEKQADQLREGINLYETGQYNEAINYFTQALSQQPNLGVAYLYRARAYRALGDTKTALTNLEMGKSYADTIADLHVETGRLHAGQGNYQTAFQDFDKAIFHAHGNSAEAFRGRGLARQHLNQPDEAQSDLNRATELATRQPAPSTGASTAKQPFFDRHLLIHAGFVLINSLLLLSIIKRSSVIHWPYLLAAASAALIGFVEPRKGWLLAMLQSVVLWIGYTYFTEPPTPARHDVEAFGLYGSIGLTFVGSFLGSILQRAQAPR